MAYGHRIETDFRGVATLILDRIEVHNAFNPELIAALTESFTALDADASVRAVVLRGAGKSFCAGADLGWMKQAAGWTWDENVVDGLLLARMLKTLRDLSKPTLALIHGNCFAGGTGIAACADVAVAVSSALFSLSEVRLGLVPATISPHLVATLGPRNARRLFLTAERFTGADALRFGLVQEVVADAAELDVVGNRFIDWFLAGSTPAIAASKRLVDDVTGREIDEDTLQLTARYLADARTSADAKEGLSAFFEKRKPKWAP
jgi:methylglutaconyl-CoA hydratase